ncbi:hypothetical protein M0802_001723 [Mischocyttarus mexicanus]|nr:hypothetical protein M0802_001723 [Mischocyttarus mexicanus]
MSTEFIHSVKVPRLYKLASKIVQDVQENGASLKTLIFAKKHPNVCGLYALTLNTLKKSDQLNQLLIATKVLINEPRFDPWLARVLITELIWGTQRLTGNSKPIQTILNYESRLRDALKNVDSDVAIPQKTVSKPRYVRVNTLLLSVQEAIENFQYEGWSLLLEYTDYSSYLKLISNLSEPYFTKDYHVPELLVFPHGTSFFNHPSYTNGKVLLQDKASCLPSLILNPPVGSVVLDMCAAPGMKTTQLAAILQNQGTIYAVEVGNRRYQTLCELLETTNSSCVRTINKDALSLGPDQYPNIEYILVDPTCSGSGIVDRPKLGKKDGEYEEGRLKNLQAFQVFLLRHALLNFPTVKKVVYSTCSINREENEDVIDEILTNVGDAYKLVSIKKYLKKDWLNYSSEDSSCKKKCIYARPEVDLCNGFFVALFKRNFDVPLPSYTPRTYDKSITEYTSFNENQEIDDQENNENQNNNSSSNCKKKKKRKKRKRADNVAEKQKDESVNLEEVNDKEDCVITSAESSKKKHKSTT